MTCSAPNCEKSKIVTRTDPQLTEPLYLCEDHAKELMCEHPDCFVPGLRYEHKLLDTDERICQSVVLCDRHLKIMEFNVKVVKGDNSGLPIRYNQFDR